MATGSSNQLFCFFFLLSLLNALISSEASPLQDFKKRQLQRLGFSHRSLLNLKTTEFDSIDPPTTTLPITNPVTTPSLTAPPANQVPPVVTNPPNPVTIPSSTPITIPNPNPVTSPIPVTNPVTTPSAIPGGTTPPINPITTPSAIPGGTTPPINPVTTPTPVGGFPVTNPTTTMPPPAVSGQGQSWCISKNGASQTALQAALDYACGMGGADCASIQQNANCYNPNSLQNHCSYAFNSYYQKNPAPTSCDFGGVAVLTNANPSSGSCIYPSSASSSSSTPAATYNPTPITTPTTASSSGSSPAGGAIPGAITPPSVLNSSTGFPDSGATTGFGATPPIMNSSTSSAPSFLRPSLGYIVFVASVTMGRFILHI